MSDSASGNLMQEMLGKFIEQSVSEAVSKAVAREMSALSAEAMDRSCQMVEQKVMALLDEGLRSLSQESERIVEVTCQRMVDAHQKAVDAIPEAAQETI